MSSCNTPGRGGLGSDPAPATAVWGTPPAEGAGVEEVVGVELDAKGVAEVGSVEDEAVVAALTGVEVARGLLDLLPALGAVGLAERVALEAEVAWL